VSRRLRLLLWLGGLFAGGLLLAVVALVFLLNSRGAAEFTLTRAASALPSDALAWDALQGSLAGGLEIEGLRYRADGLELDIERLRLQLAPPALSTGRLHLRSVEANGVRLQLPSPALDAEPGEPFDIQLPEALPGLQLPIDVQLDALSLSGFRLQNAAGEPLFEADTVALAATLNAGDLQIERLALDGPMLMLTARGQIDSGDDWRSGLQLKGQWRQGLTQPQAFELALDGPLGRLSAQLRLPDAPEVALDLQLSGGLPEPAWQLQLALPQAPSALTELMPEGLAEVALEGRGTLHTADLAGGFVYQGQRWRLGEARLQFEGRRIGVDALALSAVTEDGEPGELRAEGWLELAPAGSEAAGELVLKARFDSLPLPMPQGPALQLDGELSASGALDAAVFVLDLAVARGDLAGAVEGRVQMEGAGARLESLRIHTGEGELTANGRVDWSDGVAWKIDATLAEFAPELLLEGWPGRLSAVANSEGFYRSIDGQDEPATEGWLRLSELDGQLRDAALSGSAEFDWRSLKEATGEARLSWGGSRLRAEINVAEALSGRIELDPLALAQVLEGASGELRGTVVLEGRPEAPQARLDLRGQALRLDGLAVDALNLRGRAGSAADAPLQLLLEARGLAQAESPIGALTLTLEGSLQQHRLELALQRPQQDGLLTASGGWDSDAARWAGQLEAFDYRSTGPQAVVGGVTLDRPAALELGAQRLRIEPLCLSVAPAPRDLAVSATDALANASKPDSSVPPASGSGLDAEDEGAFAGSPQDGTEVDSGRLCLEADWSERARGRALLTLDALPVAVPGALLGRTLEPGTPWRWQGQLQGRMELQGSADDWQLQGRIESPEGALGLPGAELRRLLQWQALALELNGSPAQLALRLSGGLGGESRIDGEITLQQPLAADGGLSGRLDLALLELGALQLLSDEAVVAPVGELRADLSLSGTRSAPLLAGGARLEGFRADLPALGISPSEGFARLRLVASQAAELEFGLNSKGELRGEGRLDWSADAEQTLDLSLQGTDVLVSDTPQLRLRASPDLQLTRRGEVLELRGRLQVPSAMIRLDELEGSQQPSPDVVVLDPLQRERAATAAQAINADVQVVLGDDVRLEGFGLEGKLAGELRVRDRPGRATSGSGSVNVSGRYEAYGQKLDITRGRLSFAQSPLDNPALDIRAERKLGDVTAGIRVTGTAAAPQVTLWSDPTMDQADVLSYLVLGRPLRAARSGEGQQLNAAAAALGAGGNLLAERLGARLGLDQAGVEESTALGGAALTVGKFLSPRLYVAYGVALFGEGQVFSIKYLLSETWNLQLTTTARENRASINYRLER